MLERLADFMESQSKLRGKVGAALAYPALMMVIGTSLITVMMVVVVPKVTAIFESLDRALPWYTEAAHRHVAPRRRRTRCSGSSSRW